MDIFIDQHRTGGGYPGGDPFAADVEFLFLGEGPTDGTQTNPVSGTLTKNEVTGILQAIGDPPFTAGNLVASTSGMPFGSSWIRHPGGITSRNFYTGPLSTYKHPLVNPFCFDGYFKLDALVDTVCLFGDDSVFGGGHYNHILTVSSTGVLFFQTHYGVGRTARGIYGPSSVSAATTFHVEVWGDGVNTFGMALNGIQSTPVTTASSGNLNTLAGSSYIGSRNHYVSSYEDTITGYSKCTRFTNAVRHTTDFTPPASLAEYAL